MNSYKKWNILTGWMVFAFSTLVYILTMEPTTSLWDCSEFIATSYKLEVGHPPGAPLFMMIARFFTIFAPGPQYAAWMVNAMSSICGGFTVLFLFWTITHLAKRMYSGAQELTKGQSLTVIGAGLVGALAYCFTDTQWFSAVEGEVYSMSSMFTAMVVWAMLQWENVADQPHSNRWLVLIAYLMGLSIGVHILNLLAIPALVFIYYFKKYKVTKWGVVKAVLISGALLIAVNYIIIPYTVVAGAWVDRVFVNSLGLPVNLGITFFVIALFGLCAWGIWKTHKKGKVVANTIILCTTVILLGYSSYASVVIRAVANPPMNSNNPDNPYALFSLLNREQYGSRPLLYGPAYSSPPVDLKWSKSWYVNDEGKYEFSESITDQKYPDDFMFFFPRMWRSDKAEAYKAWTGLQGRNIRFYDEIINVPTAGENMRFFFSYQLNFMYWRYFLWNFVGRQNDIQGMGDVLDGNWMSGIKFIDEIYLGPQDNLPDEMANNKARNKYYFLPFILGLIGLLYQLNRDKRNFVVVMWLFLMMGVVLVLYFNTTPGEPRERDYVYAGSFYAFCIWIGLGVLWLRDLVSKIAKKDTVAIAAAATAVCCTVPVILAAQNWDDHNRSYRYVARDIGWNYLQSTLPNSIIICYGDNDTFPLWYNQEVEGVRPDVRIMNSSYLQGAWYIDQMRLRSNESDPVPFSLPRKKYVNNINDQLFIVNMFDRPVNIRDVMNYIKSDDPRTQERYGSQVFDVIPTEKIILPVNKDNAIASGIVKPEDAHLMVDSIVLNLGRTSIMKHELMFLDLLATFDWTRPIYFTTINPIVTFGLRDYLQFDGYAYRLVPIRTPYDPFEPGRIDTEDLYDRLMGQFRYGNISDPRVYVDYFTRYNLRSADARGSFGRLAKELVTEGQTSKAVEVLDAAIAKIPFDQFPHSYLQTYPLIEAYYMAGEIEKGNAVFDDFARTARQHVDYYMQFKGGKLELVYDKMGLRIHELVSLMDLADEYGEYGRANEIDKYLADYGI